MPTNHLTVIDVLGLTEPIRQPWKNFELTRVNDHVIRCSVLERDFHWHKHEGSDEAFFVLEGRLAIDLDDRTIRLGPGQIATVPKGTRHRTRAEGRVVNLIFEREDTTVGGD